MPKPALQAQPSVQADPGSLAEARVLLVAVGHGDQQAFASLYDAVSARLFGLVMGIIRDRSAAEDVLQEAFMQIWRRASTYDPDRADPLVWMMLIVRGKAIDHLRRRGAAAAAVARAAELVPPAPPAPDPVERRSLRDAALKALATLPADQREALTLAFFGGLTGSEIAHARGLPLGTVKTRIRTGLERLRDAFTPPREVSA